MRLKSLKKNLKAMILLLSISVIGMSGCAGRASLPRVDVPARPKLLFLSRLEGKAEVCLTNSDLNKLMGYVLELETAVGKAKATIDDANE